ncbi:MAG: sugar phosphate isomerase/epimerase [Bacteroidales bacterium]|nr:sugar phosphate isomerase/epimerase [Bacteroidales bacterium]
MKKSIIMLSAILVMALCACSENAQAPVKKEMGVQLYSVRSVFNAKNYAETHENVFKELASYGYTAVEPAGYSDGKLYGVTPEQFKADVEAAGMKVLSTHVKRDLTPEEFESGDFTEAMKWWDLCIETHKKAGCKYVCTSSIKAPATVKDLQTICDYFNAIGKKCAEAGIKYGYHSHSFEFNKIEDQVVMEDYMIEHTDPQYVFFEMDVYWAVMGKASPVVYFKKYPGRFSLLHIKDYREIGQSGMVGFDAIFKNFDVAGCNNFVVELERGTGDDIMPAMKESAEYLLNADFVKPSYE